MQNVSQLLSRIATVVVALVIVLYFGDYVVVKMRSDPTGTCQVTKLYAIAQKSGKTEYEEGDSETQTCANSLFPHPVGPTRATRLCFELRFFRNGLLSVSVIHSALYNDDEWVVSFSRLGVRHEERWKHDRSLQGPAGSVSAAIQQTNCRHCAFFFRLGLSLSRHTGPRAGSGPGDSDGRSGLRVL